MKKFFYLAALLMLSLTFVVSCSEDKKDEPEVTETPPPPPPAPTTADSLQGTWYSVSGQIAGTAPVSGPFTFSTNLAVLGYDTLKFSSNTVTHTWVPVTPNASWPHKIVSGTFAVSNGILTNTMTYQKKWTTPPPGIPEITTISETPSYKISFATNDTLKVIMTGSTMITTNKYTPAMGLAGNTNTASINEPILTLKFKRKP